MSDYGVLKDVVGTAGALIAAGGAISFAFRRGARWEPAEDDVPSAPARVAGLLVSVLIAVMWYQSSHGLTASQLTLITYWTLGLAVVGLLLYVFLVNSFVYVREVAVSAKKTSKINIIGGFWLTGAAKRKLSESDELTIQRLLQGASNDPDLVWSRAGRGLAKIWFIIAFLMLQVFGSIALAAAALLVNIQG